jgi:hypothetical protein
MVREFRDGCLSQQVGGMLEFANKFALGLLPGMCGEHRKGQAEHDNGTHVDPPHLGTGTSILHNGLVNRHTWRTGGCRKSKTAIGGRPAADPSADMQGISAAPARD